MWFWPLKTTPVLLVVKIIELKKKNLLGFPITTSPSREHLVSLVGQ